MFARLEKLKHQIHSFRIPIKDQRTLNLVKMIYFVTPIIIGSAVMQYVIPEPDELKSRFKSNEYAEAVTAHQREGLREVLDRAKSGSSSS